jgi:hypothetical protein
MSEMDEWWMFIHLQRIMLSWSLNCETNHVVEGILHICTHNFNSIVWSILRPLVVGALKLWGHL